MGKVPHATSETAENTITLLCNCDWLTFFTITEVQKKSSTMWRKSYADLVELLPCSAATKAKVVTKQEQSFWIAPPSGACYEAVSKRRTSHHLHQ
jgi:hypothetical protein